MHWKSNVQTSTDAQWLVWECDGMPRWVVVLDGWLGSTCQIHQASLKTTAPPRSMIRAVFKHGFRVMKRTHIFGVVNSKDESVVRLDKWLGFREIYRVPGAHIRGGDIVLLEMTPADCRWLET